MLSKDARRHAAQQYKTRSPNRGVYAVRCVPTQQVWVGTAQDLFAAHNRLWFALRTHAHRGGTLQAEWAASGEDAFRFEVLEVFEPDVSTITLKDLLKDKRRHWAAQLSAEVLL
jgi:hypothetical protein